MSEDITIRVVHTDDVVEEKVVSYLFANVLPLDRVELEGPNGAVELVDDDQDFGDVEISDIEQAIEQVKP